jgi:hypothetical protein
MDLSPRGLCVVGLETTGTGAGPDLGLGAMDLKLSLFEVMISGTRLSVAGSVDADARASDIDGASVTGRTTSTKGQSQMIATENKGDSTTHTHLFLQLLPRRLLQIDCTLYRPHLL